MIRRETNLSEKIRIIIKDKGKGEQYSLLHTQEKTLLETMREGAVVLPSLCAGMGKCGKCMVRFCNYAPLPTQTDRLLLSPDQLREGFRLACMARPRRTCTIEADFIKAKEKEEGMLHVVAEYYMTDTVQQEEDESDRDCRRDAHTEDKECEKHTECTKRKECRQIECAESKEQKECIKSAESAKQTENAKQTESAIQTESARQTESVMQKGCKERAERIHKAYSGRGGRTLVAADIGTTTIAMQLTEQDSGRILDTYTCLNPQRSYGTDVIARIKAAAEGDGETLQRLVRDALAAGVRQFQERAKEQGVLEPELLCVACNTAMGHIFLGYPTETLGKSPFVPVDINMTVTRLGSMEMAVMPGASAFVGGDIVAGLYACGLIGVGGQIHAKEADGRSVQHGLDTDQVERKNGETAWLFLDLGTNAEMVMGDGQRMAATAAAAGPAFEGRGRDGVNGSERIRAIAKLLEMGAADYTGLLAEPYFEQGIDIDAGSGKVHVTQADIREIQLAKAAVRAGIYFLMEKLGIQGYNKIRKVYLAGGMGFYLDKKAAARIGLLPEELAKRAETVGNASLAGACFLGRGDWKKKGLALEQEARRIEAFQMAELPKFSDIYMEYMDFDCQVMPGMV